MVAQQAIIVRDAMKRYGNAQIMNGLNLTVEKGSIYGLLGASGCGKTTLLSCVVGIRQLDSGQIWVLGGHPGTKGSGIPGPRVGYMPQEISLVQESSVIGAFYYFGRINGLDDDTIEEKYTFLKDLLQLPPKGRLIRNMSGGQQRRVSFAVSLMHSPELLILDEPTVGLDPVLRDNIWNYLLKITREEGTTVVITTHYIEEAKQADKIGLLRRGQLLADSSPSELLERFQMESLEDVFLKLSQLQAEGQGNAVTNSPPTLSLEFNETATLVDINQNTYAGKRCNEKKQNLGIKKFQALLEKNALQFIRHPGGVLFAMLLPIVQILIFFNAIGLDPKGLKIAVVNDEAGNCDYGRNLGNVTYDENELTCSFVDLSCRFLYGFNDSVAKKIYYDDLYEAQNSVKRDRTVAVMYFGRNFSRVLETRLIDLFSVPDESIAVGQIQIWLENGDRQISIHMKKKLYEEFFEIYEGIMQDCKIPPKFAAFPIRFEDPIFGTLDQKYSTFMAPAFILSLVFFLATSVCSAIIIADRHGGVWDRSLVQGVTTAEILITHLISQLTVIFIQVAATLCITFLQFDLECKGSLTAVVWLVLLEGVCGMSYGFLISIMCKSHTFANYVSTGSFYPMILLCGCIWPVEGMPKFLRWLSFTLPTTLPSISMRGLLNKGYPVNDPEVYTGFLIIAAWILSLIGLCFFGLRSKKA